MLRKALWSILSTGLRVAGVTLAGKMASRAWRIATGEEPPKKR